MKDWANQGFRTRLLGLALIVILLSLVAPPASAAFPGRNGRISFNARIPGPGDSVLLGDYNVFTTSPSGAGIQQVTDHPFADFQAQWSPDGTRLVYTHVNPFVFFQADVYVLDTVTGETTNITNSPFMEAFASWSPDGSRILFSSDRANPAGYRPGLPPDDLYIMDADGSNVEQLTSGPEVDFGAAWAPDGSRIAFRSGPNLVLIRPDGSQRRQLVADDVVGSPGPFAAQWSPDSKRLTFSTGAFRAPGGDVWRINADGTGLRNLTQNNDASNRYAAWSPDGRSIVFVSDRDGSYKLYKMRPDGTHVVKLTDMALEADAGPNWGPRP